MRARRVDANLKEIVDEFRRLGCAVHVTNDMWDLTISLGGLVMLIEVKDGAKPPSAKRLSKRAKEFYKTWLAHPRIVENKEQAKEVVEVLMGWHEKLRG